MKLKIVIVVFLLIVNSFIPVFGKYIGMYNGNDGCIKEFISGIKSLLVDENISVDIKKEIANKIVYLLDAKSPEGIAAFCMAMRNGNEGCVREFISGIKSLLVDENISVDIKKEIANKIVYLLDAKIPYGRTAFYVAMQDGHEGCVREFI